MKMYYTRFTNAQIKHERGQKPASCYPTGNGPKKYDRVKLECKVKGCENEFYVSSGSNSILRLCEEHWQEHVKPKPVAQMSTGDLLDRLLNRC